MKRFLVVLFLVPFVVVSQNKLQNAKKDLKPKSKTIYKSKTRRVRTKHVNTRRTYSIQNSFDNFLIELGFYATLGVAVGYAEERDLNPYPYFYNNEGEYAAELSETGRKQSIKIGANYVFNKISGFELDAVYKPIPILAINPSYIHFSEKKIRGGVEALNIFSLMVNYHRFREKNFTFWWGVGVTHIGNEINETGFTYALGTEIYPVNPISLHVSWKESFINVSGIQMFKAQLKYHLKNKSFFVGYHNYRLGFESISAPVLGFEIIF